MHLVMGQLTTRADVAVIGGGPGGYTAAIRAAQLGLEAVLIEKALIGGCCTNVGCIPSKALIHAAEVKHRAESAGGMGVHASVALDFAATERWAGGVAKELRDGITALCGLNGVEIIRGRARFTSSGTLAVETEEGLRGVEFRNAVIATGTVPKELPGLPFGHPSIISSDGVFSLTSLPERLLIAGGGYVAVEMACMFSRFGSKVTVVHHGDRLLKSMEPEISGLLLAKMKGAGIEVLFRSEITGTAGGEAAVKGPEGEMRVGFDRLLVAAGRATALEGLGLEKTKVRLEGGLVSVDSAMRTADNAIFAVGDIVPGPQLAHKAFRQGKVAAEAIAGRKSAFDNRAIPAVVFSHPEIASVGLTEEEAARQGRKAVAGKMPYSASGWAKTMGAPDGFVKVVAGENGMLLGAHIIGEGAGNLIAEAALAIEMAATLEDVAATIHAHPTLPEALAEAAEDALGRAIHHYHGRR